jgi:two-component system response regulator FixJ
VIVDDDDAVRDSTCVLLESCGYDCVSYVSADAFLEKTGGRMGDCLLLDVQMPGTSGVELLELLRTRRIETPVILMTANVERLGNRGAAAGALTVLRKPFAEDVLLRWIARACDQNAPSA